MRYKEIITVYAELHTKHTYVHSMGRMYNPLARLQNWLRHVYLSLRPSVGMEHLVFQVDGLP